MQIKLEEGETLRGKLASSDPDYVPRGEQYITTFFDYLGTSM